MSIQKKASEQYFSVVLFITQYKVAVTFDSVDEILWCEHSDESFWVKYFSCGTVMQYVKVVVTFESVDEILWCEHSDESFWAVLFCGTVYYAVH